MPESSAPGAVTQLVASTPQGIAGDLQGGNGDYFFGYRADAPQAAEISLLMPKRPAQYQDQRLFPLFQMNLPEGHVLELITARFAKAATLDPMMLLALTGHDAAIGRVALQAPEVTHEEVEPLTLSTLLANEGANDLFEALSHRYLLRSGISGVQPKLLLPRAHDDALPGGRTIATSELIVKAGNAQFDALPVNEYVCMRIAQEAGIQVPEFHLSQDLKRFVMERFDRTPEGDALGFEDMAVLSNRGTRDKYTGSYSQIAKLITAFCARGRITSSLEQYFDQVALSILVGNGDAHLKNFGLLYSTPGANDARLSPAYDIVCTTCYIPEDALALELMGTRSFLVARTELVEFGKTKCRIDDPLARIGKLIDAAETILFCEDALMDEALPALKIELRRGIDRMTGIVEAGSRGNLRT